MLLVELQRNDFSSPFIPGMLGSSNDPNRKKVTGVKKGKAGLAPPLITLSNL
jgi:hypothetical protein